MTIDLNQWHHDAHQVTGAMALKFNSATPADLIRWAAALRKLAVAGHSIQVARIICLYLLELLSNRTTAAPLAR